MLRASPAPPYLKRGLHAKAPSPPNLTLKPSYSQVVKTKTSPCDPEKWARDPGKMTRDISRDPSSWALTAVDYVSSHAPKKE